MVIVDTNVIIDHLRQKKDDSLLQKIAQTNSNIGLSIISVQELFTGKSTLNKNSHQALISILNSLQILPYNYSIAKSAGQINRDLNPPIQLADAAIAVTAIHHQSPLATFNQKHFKHIPKLELFKL